ncbi:MAG: hypothetical protein M3142_14095, partial [Bacteroidota bacterium]|nr:hypothetical protein [Bacteroidota bacterium]
MANTMKNYFYSSSLIQNIYLSLTQIFRGKKTGLAIKFFSFLLISVTFIVLSAFTLLPANEQEVTVHLRRFLEEERVNNYFANHAQKEALSTALTMVYSTNNFAPVW